MQVQDYVAIILDFRFIAFALAVPPGRACLASQGQAASTICRDCRVPTDFKVDQPRRCWRKAGADGTKTDRRALSHLAD
ncbi:hypothetical protein CO2235_230400 [Cupriavidus oxalaticus]|uniref:Uncharacterized protein n=3 Tax=Cupriavidus TaxID=106589 RepID=A0A976BE21_9BURK|nr:hypothetical protein CO2235_230400 [Cupriavidus oxalaticus]